MGEVGIEVGIIVFLLLVLLIILVITGRGKGGGGGSPMYGGVDTRDALEISEARKDLLDRLNNG